MRLARLAPIVRSEVIAAARCTQKVLASLENTYYIKQAGHRRAERRRSLAALRGSEAALAMGTTCSCTIAASGARATSGGLG